MFILEYALIFERTSSANTIIIIKSVESVDIKKIKKLLNKINKNSMIKN